MSVMENQINFSRFTTTINQLKQLNRVDINQLSAHTRTDFTGPGHVHLGPVHKQSIEENLEDRIAVQDEFQIFSINRAKLDNGSGMNRATGWFTGQQAHLTKNFTPANFGNNLLITFYNGNFSR
jgi:hypothetical protein